MCACVRVCVRACVRACVHLMVVGCQHMIHDSFLLILKYVYFLQNSAYINFVQSLTCQNFARSKKSMSAGDVIG